MKTIAATLTAVSLATTAAGPAGAAVHGLYPLYIQHSDLLHFIDTDSRRHHGARYYTQVEVLRRKDVDTMPTQIDANRLRIKLRSLTPVRVESWAADCSTDTVQVQEFAGSKSTGMYSGWLVPEFGSIGYEVLTFLCPRPALKKTGAQVAKAERTGGRKARQHSG